MGLLTKARNTPMKDVAETLYPLPMEAATVIYMGGMVATDDNGLAVPAQPATGTTPFVNSPRVIGIAARVVGGNFGEDAHNVAGASMIPTPPNLGSASALMLEVKRGIAFLDINDGTVVQASVGQMCFAADDHSVSMNDGWGETSYVNESHVVPASPGPYTDTLTHVTGGVSGVSVHTASPGGTVGQQGLDYTFVPSTGVVTIIVGGPAGFAAGQTLYFDYMNTTVEPVVVAADTAGTIPTAALGYHLDLKHENIIPGSIVGATSSVIGITDCTQSSVLHEGVDFDVDYQAGIITFIPGGAGSATAADTLAFGYSYKGTAPVSPRPVVGRVVQIETTYGASGPGAWVDMRDQSVTTV